MNNLWSLHCSSLGTLMLAIINNHLHTVLKANFPPYGRDFENHNPTGRFSNGKLTVDYIAEALGFTSYPPAYLNLDTKGKNLLNGANFASAGSGYCDYTAKLYGTIPLSPQLEYYRDCQKELMKIVGQSNALTIISGAIYVVADGASDFVLNYYPNPLLHKVYTADQFSDILMRCYYNFIQNLYVLGARKIGVITLGPLGCLPAIITLFGSHGNKCVAKLNNDAINFNKKLNSTSQNLRKMLPASTWSSLIATNLCMTWSPSLLNMVQNLIMLVSTVHEPGLLICFYVWLAYTITGFFEARKACCGTGLLEGVIFCNQMSIGTCANASEYVFWDAIHLSEAAYKILADELILDGISLLS